MEASPRTASHRPRGASISRSPRPSSSAARSPLRWQPMTRPGSWPRSDGRHYRRRTGAVLHPAPEQGCRVRGVSGAVRLTYAAGQSEESRRGLRRRRGCIRGSDIRLREMNRTEFRVAHTGTHRRRFRRRRDSTPRQWYAERRESPHSCGRARDHGREHERTRARERDPATGPPSGLPSACACSLCLE